MLYFLSPKTVRYLAGLALLLLATTGFGQQLGSLSGNVTGPKGDTLIGVTVRVNSASDSTVRLGNVTGLDGRFLFENLPAGSYKVLASFVGYNTTEQTVQIDSGRVELPTIILLETARQLNEVVVKGKTPTAEQKGDTLQMNANAFKVNRDAQAEDLLKKMPGIDMSGGGIKVQGEDVREILVDGKPFFGDDPTIALRNLPAEVIDKIEVFDRQSDQSQFTGVNDGNTLKTINIITRPDRRNGQFGKVYAGVGTPVDGTDATFAAGGSVNLFKGDRRISVIAQSNNINQQNFASQDLLGVLGGGGGGNQRQGGGGGGRGGRGGGGGAPGGGGGGGGGGGSTDNFLVGQQSGINTTNSLGINYTDSWGKKMTIRGSYFLNQSNNRNEQSLLREYYQNGDDSTQTYREQSTNSSSNLNHRLNFRLDYTINRNNSLLITPRLSFQTNESGSLTNSETRLGNSLLNRSDNSFGSNNNGLSFSNSILFRHRFEKRGRTFSLNLGTSVNNRDGMSTLASINDFISADTITRQAIDQRTTNLSNGYQLSANLNYTEPLGKGLLQLSYSAGINRSNSDRFTYRLNPASDRYDLLDSLLSNRFDNDYLTQRAGVGYNVNTKTLRLSASVDLQRADLESQQLFPRTDMVNRAFTNLLPTVTADYRFTDDLRLRFNYRTNTQAPSINQLQNVLNNTNPLLQTIGNPDLKQSYSHNVSARFTKTAVEKASSLVALISANYTQDPIGSSLFIADSAMTVPGIRSPTGEGIFLQKGTQLTRPINTEDAVNLRLFASYGRPLSFIKSNVNLNTSLNFNRAPSVINFQVNRANSYAISQGVVLSSNISEKVDFTLSYTYGYNQVVNSLQPQLNTSFSTQRAGANVTWNIWKGMVLRSDVNYQQYAGLSGGFNQEFTLWNASFAQRMFKSQNGELRLSVFDLLNQNNSISRTFSETYLEDSRSLVLNRYFMLTFTYTLRQFKA
ncbi:TonB-dependent receptor domain-containing protein [Fibrella aquatica]|uniref:TonB-dependent receptor domain-containing protein n=1 Tax=Fibrella aquatica TaxID=3242487 RepID=UPI003521B7D6